MKGHLTSVLAISVAICAPVAAQDIVVTNARILDGTGRVIERGSVLVRDGRIVSVSAGTTAAQGSRAIDVQGKTIVPGFVDAHRHVIRGDAAQWFKAEAPARLQEFLDAGFTTVLSAGDQPEAILELRKRLRQRELKGPRLFAAGRVPLARPAAPLANAGGRGGAPAGDPARFDVSRPPRRPSIAGGAIPQAETVNAVEAVAKAGFDYIKTAITVSPGGPRKTPWP